MTKVYDPAKAKDGGAPPREPMSLKDLEGLSREAIQRLLKQAYDNFDKRISNLYTRGIPNENLSDLAELESLCAQYGVFPATEDPAEAECKRKEERRKEIREKVRIGELPPLPPLPPGKDYGALAGHPLVVYMQRRREQRFFDDFYGVA